MDELYELLERIFHDRPTATDANSIDWRRKMKYFLTLDQLVDLAIRYAQNSDPGNWEWLTNSSADECEEVVRSLAPSRCYKISWPRKTARYTSAELVNQGMVGIYRKPSESIAAIERIDPEVV
jgi:hypothetical protein